MYGRGAFGGSVGAYAQLRFDAFQFTLAGRYGDESRPTFLNDSIVYATDDRIRGSFSAQARWRVGASSWLSIGYEWQRMTAGGTSAAVDADGHFFSAGWVGAF
jgi:hypothetical protein